MVLCLQQPLETTKKSKIKNCKQIENPITYTFKQNTCFKSKSPESKIPHPRNPKEDTLNTRRRNRLQPRLRNERPLRNEHGNPNTTEAITTKASI